MCLQGRAFHSDFSMRVLVESYYPKSWDKYKRSFFSPEIERKTYSSQSINILLLFDIYSSHNNSSAWKVQPY